MLQLETEAGGARSAALAAAPIAVHSALDRSAARPIAPGSGTVAVEGGDTAGADAGDWPPADVEDAMIAEAAERDRPAAAPSRRRRDAADTLEGGPLPTLGEMIAAIPASLQEQLDDLFRAKFQAVRRVPAAVLKSAASAENERAADESPTPETTDEPMADESSDDD